jgi:competence protein ComGD
MTQPKGFTLIESLIVLSVVSIFVLLPILAIDQYQKQIEVIGFCGRLEKGLYTAQQTAIIDQRQTRVAYTSGTDPAVHFQSTVTGELRLSSIDVPEQLEVRSFPTILFSSNSGNNSSFPRIVLYWPEKEQTITYKFLFGSGRYEKIIE